MFRLNNVTLGLIIVIAVLVLAIIYMWTKDKKENMEPITQVPEPQKTLPPEPKKSPLLVLFKADWCPACQNFMPEWEKLKQGIQGTFETKELTEQDDFKKHGIEGLPTVRYFPEGIHVPDNYINYNGRRTMEDILKFLSTLR
jgi:thioredoxin-like negative regulator of GroEL